MVLRWLPVPVAQGLRGGRHRRPDVQRFEGTAVTELALAGCTEAEIATITGHSLGDVRPTKVFEVT